MEIVVKIRLGGLTRLGLTGIFILGACAYGYFEGIKDSNINKENRTW